MSRQGLAAGASGFSYGAVSSSKSQITKKAVQTQVRNKPREKHVVKVEIWRCKICNRDFDTQPGLNRHFTTVHELPKPKTEKEVKAPYKAITQNIVCRICGSNFANQGNLTRHLNTVHQKPPPKAGNNNVAMSKSTKITQKNKTNVTINVYTNIIKKN